MKATYTEHNNDITETLRVDTLYELVREHGSHVEIRDRDSQDLLGQSQAPKSIRSQKTYLHSEANCVRDIAITHIT